MRLIATAALLSAVACAHQAPTDPAAAGEIAQARRFLDGIESCGAATPSPLPSGTEEVRGSLVLLGASCTEMGCYPPCCNTCQGNWGLHLEGSDASPVILVPGNNRPLEWIVGECNRPRLSQEVAGARLRARGRIVSADSAAASVVLTPGRFMRYEQLCRL
jgi:hypothetical protein